VDTWTKDDAESEALCNDLVGLEASQWDTQSLSAEWKVRHVVAHLVEMIGRTAGSLFVAHVELCGRLYVSKGRICAHLTWRNSPVRQGCLDCSPIRVRCEVGGLAVLLPRAARVNSPGEGGPANLLGL